jgi:hypothetical protein
MKRNRNKVNEFCNRKPIERRIEPFSTIEQQGILVETFYLKNGFYNNQKRTVMVRELQ